MEWRTSLIRLLKKPMIRAEKISSRFQVRSVIDRIHQHADQHAGHLYADRAEDDPADPSLGLHHAARLDADNLPDEGRTGRTLDPFLTVRRGPRLAVITVSQTKRSRFESAM